MHFTARQKAHIQYFRALASTACGFYPQDTVSLGTHLGVLAPQLDWPLPTCRAPLTPPWAFLAMPLGSPGSPLVVPWASYESLGLPVGMHLAPLPPLWLPLGTPWASLGCPRPSLTSPYASVTSSGFQAHVSRKIHATCRTLPRGDAPLPRQTAPSLL